jgi:hypothetical protein
MHVQSHCCAWRRPAPRSYTRSRLGTPPPAAAGAALAYSSHKNRLLRAEAQTPLAHLLCRCARVLPLPVAHTGAAYGCFSKLSVCDADKNVCSKSTKARGISKCIAGRSFAGLFRTSAALLSTHERGGRRGATSGVMVESLGFCRTMRTAIKPGPRQTLGVRGTGLETVHGRSARAKCLPLEVP